MIDLHAHVVLDATLGAAGRYGPELDEGDPATGRPPCYRVGDYELLGVRYRDSAFMDVDLRLAQMDERGIDLQVLSPNPLTFLHHVDAHTAIEFLFSLTMRLIRRLHPRCCFAICLTARAASLAKPWPQ